jgi:hypothetical protein
MSRRPHCLVDLVIGVALTSAAYGPAAAEDPPEADRTNASRLRAMREVVGEISIESAEQNDERDLAINLDPLLRYNDVSRGIADSTVWRVGTEGRPIAIITAELYGREGNIFLLNHEFLALDNPRVRMQRDQFKWEPTQGILEFQPIENAPATAKTDELRLVQLKRLAGEFTATERLGDTKIVLRLLPTPIGRYAPSAVPNADAAIFACVWGVNPEALLFVETDGTDWSFAWARLGAATVWAERDGDRVWEQPVATEHEHPTAPYTSIHRRINVPPYFDDESEETD